MRAARWVNNSMKARPMAWGMGITVVKTSAADLIAQKLIEKRETVDLKRNLIFTSFGFFYLGGFQYALYNHILPRMFPGTGTKVVLKRLFFDQVIHHPALYFPTFYAIKTAVQGDSIETGFRNFKAELPENMVALWKVWVPSMFVCFAFVPPYLRIPYVSGVSFFWTTILSVMQGRFDTTRSINTRTASLATISGTTPAIREEDTTAQDTTRTDTTTTTTAPAKTL